MIERKPFRHKKNLGQNFLADRNILRKIVERAAPAAGDVILEVGSGQGVLTRELLASPCTFLFSMEIDRGLEPFLSDISLLHPGRFCLIWGDALEADYSLLSPAPSKVVANIPYNITTPLLWKLLETLPSAGYFLLMVQKESAERITAPPSTKERYPLGVTLELTGSARKVLNVPPAAFRPVPAVHSCLLEITLGKEHRELATDGSWRGMLRSGFAQRRKKLLNNLKTFREDIPWPEVFAELGIGKNARAEELSAEKWLALHQKIKK
ncbi:16S rRNA (adenine(1518)-N(6)/adenine(1519)-N(6))-dimethyltransferase RsmA [Aminivibrio sp.]|jgi:16S rRNA (adenine1518-N6/adenine1519-N6)-dimethyltransferase|uniref:16S rRNA (adenine(1518)-N(6)/adenine(1519)-N(6))- dimethyltransferase RsmA n=1 Tax=Aminivibrio sp. TaxID=1872489 RepID=UPI001A5DE388|nr:16S rRNA (adenine(1518)-N(6)/adenine(1519)-N(6))-dimethyltransferase RsmA [Aminivibrio sp.]MBL3538584.1 ribosomal RNA small subunit methyltransferase A [Aminivibrio sp.]